MSGTVRAMTQATWAPGARGAVATAVRLAFGAPLPAELDVDWRLTFDVASHELLAPLAWARSDQLIRARAEPSVVRAWRRTALAAFLRGQQQLELLRSATAALSRAAVDAVVLKGLPLGEQLYGDPFVRCSADIDLYVPAPQRARASAALQCLGWRSVDGAAPWHQTWSLWQDDTEYHLELHSSLVCDHLAHLRLAPPTVATTTVGCHTIPTHVGPFVAPYLAAHLATHQLAPLLWLVDFVSLWRALPESTRAQSERAADAARLGRYLRWACDRGTILEQACAGDENALGALGVGAEQRAERHSIWRHLALAASTRDRLRVAASFAFPRPVRHDVRALARYTIARLRTRLRSLGTATRSYVTNGAAPEPVGEQASTFGNPLRLERSEMVALTGDVVGAGGALWVRAPGGSMLPAISRGALVRVEAVPTAGLANGDVVLALSADGEPLIHRVVAVFEGHITTRGDAAIHDDPPVPLSRVIGLATHVRDRTGQHSLAHRPRRSVTVTMLKLRRRVARVVRRAR